MEMLTIKTIRDLEYYLQQLMADYYLGPAMTGKEPPGRWTGKLAADLGLSGVVDPDVLRSMWRGVGPGGEMLSRGARYAGPGRDELQQRIDQAISDAKALNPLLTAREEEQIASRVRARVRHSVVAWDWTQSGVKSLTMTWAGLLARSKQAAVRGDEKAAAHWQKRANDIADALNETVDETIAEFERTALFTRTGHHGNGAYRDGRGVAGAKFLQHTNRNGDPQLHVQTVLFNTVQRADGADDEFRAVYSRAMMRSRLGMAAIANRVLAQKLARAGFPLVHRADGNGFEIGGVRGGHDGGVLLPPGHGHAGARQAQSRVRQGQRAQADPAGAVGDAAGHHDRHPQAQERRRPGAGRAAGAVGAARGARRLAAARLHSR